MSIDVSPAKAVSALRDRFGSRIEADHDGGLRLMMDVLQKAFKLSAGDAKTLVKDLERARMVRYHAEPPQQIVGGLGLGGSLSPEENIVPMQVQGYGNYWQI